MSFMCWKHPEYDAIRDGPQWKSARIRNIRGFSTFMAFDVDERDDLVSKLEDLQVVVGSCGECAPLNPESGLHLRTSMC